MNGKVTGIVLAGGKGSRMGGVDKGLQPLRGKPMAAWAIARLKPQVDEIVINANQNLEIYAAFGYRVVPDEIGGFAGPLAGLHAGLNAATHPLAATVPCDSPFLPADLVSRLQARWKKMTWPSPRPATRRIRCSSLLKTLAARNLEASSQGGGRKIDAWYASLKVVEVPFDDEADAFRNINTLEELGKA